MDEDVLKTIIEGCNPEEVVDRLHLSVEDVVKAFETRILEQPELFEDLFIIEDDFLYGDDLDWMEIDEGFERGELDFFHIILDSDGFPEED